MNQNDVLHCEPGDHPFDTTDNPYESKGTIEKWRKDYYQPISERFYDAAVPKLLTRMGVKPDDYVLDGGCGTGVHSVRAARFGARMMAMDISAAMLDVAKENAAKAGFEERIAFQQETLTGLTFPDATFDHVFSWGVIFHIPEIDQALDELVRVLKPGGSLGLYLTNRYALDLKLERVARRCVGKKPKDVESNEWGDGHWHEMPGGKMWTAHVDAKTLTKHLEAKGLSRTHRYAGEFTEMQKNLTGMPRSMVLRMNNLLFSVGAPAGLSSGQFLVFKKPSA